MEEGYIYLLAVDMNDELFLLISFFFEVWTLEYRHGTELIQIATIPLAMGFNMQIKREAGRDLLLNFEWKIRKQKKNRGGLRSSKPVVPLSDFGSRVGDHACFLLCQWKI